MRKGKSDPAFRIREANGGRGWSFREWQSALTRQFVEAVQRLGGIHHRWPATHLDGHGQHVAQFVAGGTAAHQRLDMETDAGLAFGSDGDAQGDEFLGLELQNAAFLDRLAKGAKGLGGVGYGLVERPQLLACVVQFTGSGHIRTPRCVSSIS